MFTLTTNQLRRLSTQIKNINKLKIYIDKSVQKVWPLKSILYFNIILYEISVPCSKISPACPVDEGRRAKILEQYRRAGLQMSDMDDEEAHPSIEDTNIDPVEHKINKKLFKITYYNLSLATSYTGLSDKFYVV